jgi:hypothetical protein
MLRKCVLCDRTLGLACQELREVVGKLPWACGVCTCENIPQRTRCEVCDAPAPSLAQRAKAMQAPSAAAAVVAASPSSMPRSRQGGRSANASASGPALSATAVRVLTVAESSAALLGSGFDPRSLSFGSAHALSSSSSSSPRVAAGAVPLHEFSSGSSAWDQRRLVALWVREEPRVSAYVADIGRLVHEPVPATTDLVAADLGFAPARHQLLLMGEAAGGEPQPLSVHVRRRALRTFVSAARHAFLQVRLQSACLRGSVGSQTDASEWRALCFFVCFDSFLSFVRLCSSVRKLSRP